MRVRNGLVLSCVIGVLSACGASQGEPKIAEPQMPKQSTLPPAEPIPRPELSNELVTKPDLGQRLARFAPYVVDFDDSKLSSKQRTVLKHAVEASRGIHELFMHQMDPRLGSLRAKLASDPTKAEALKLFDVMAGPWDALDHDERFVGEGKRPVGAGFYPPDMTKGEFEGALAKSGDKKDSFQSYFTVVERRGGALTPVPYSEAYARWLDPIARHLREAAAASDEPTLKRFLELRAAAFSSNSYAESDKAWMDVAGPIEITIGPYETYADQLFQYKATFEAFVALRDLAESKKLEVVGKQMAALERNLPMADKYKKEAASRAKGSPIDVVHLLCNAGQSGVQTVAYNLPNDEHVRAVKGSKKVMLKNLIHGKFDTIVKPIAARLIAEDQLPLLNADASFTYILMHEVAHGVGPGFISLPDGTKTEINKALRELYGGVEEAKADITGLVNAQYLIDKNIYPKSLEKEIYVAYLGTALRQMRFGVKEAHGKGVVASINYLTKKGGIVQDDKSLRYRIDHNKIKSAVRDLAREYLTLEAEGNYDGAKKFFDEYAVVSSGMQNAIARIGSDIPTDIHPVFAIYDKVKTW